MINIQQLPPQIDFGFGRTVKNVSRNTAVTVWLSSLYNEQAYGFALTAPNGLVTSLSNYEYNVTYSQPGVYSLSLAVTHNATGTRLISNTLTLTIY